MRNKTPLGKTELVLLIAAMFAIVAFSIDPMLPALPQIAADLNLSNPTLASYVMLVFLVGLGIGTLFAGPVSDAVGRRPVVFVSLAIFTVGALLSAVANSLEMMLAARLLQGFGAAGPRVVSAAIVRDTFKGREMAQIMSMSILVFLCIPAIAPAAGALITELAGWRMIFSSFILFAAVLFLWFYLRQPETHPVEKRRPLQAALLLDALRQMYVHPYVRLSVLAQALIMGSLFALLSMVQPIFEITFDRAESFPYWFGAIAIFSAISSVINARLVVRFGMRRLIAFVLHVQIVLSALALGLLSYGTQFDFVVYLVWQTGLFMMAATTQANLTSFAAEPMGHIAGFTASVIAAFSTIGGTIIGFGAALLFDGTALPLVGLCLALIILASLLVGSLKQAELRIAAE